tara:strand:- start:2511 stop:2975 length:465 start_codon:yes stop_codon:yes gene_type:complete
MLNSGIARAAVSLGATSLLTHAVMRLVRLVHPASFHELVLCHPAIVDAHPSLCMEIGQLANLEQDDAFKEIMEVLADIVSLEGKLVRGNEFKLGRASSLLEKKLRDIVDRTESWRSDHLFNEKRIAIEDTLPTVERQVENILHNFISDFSSEKG